MGQCLDISNCHIWEEVTYSHVMGRGQRYSSISPNAHRQPLQQWVVWPQMSGEPRRKGFAIYDEACLASPKYSIPTPKRKPKTFSNNIILKSISSYSVSICLSSHRKVKLLSHVQLFAAPWTVAYQASQSIGFSRQEYWSGLPLPSPRDLPDPGIKPRSTAL